MHLCPICNRRTRNALDDDDDDVDDDDDETVVGYEQFERLLKLICLGVEI